MEKDKKWPVLLAIPKQEKTEWGWNDYLNDWTEHVSILAWCPLCVKDHAHGFVIGERNVRSAHCYDKGGAGFTQYRLKLPLKELKKLIRTPKPEHKKAPLRGSDVKTLRDIIKEL